MFNSVNPKVCTAAAEKRCAHREASKAAEREQHTEKREGTTAAGEAVRADTATAARVHFYHMSFTAEVSADPTRALIYGKRRFWPRPGEGSSGRRKGAA